MEERQNISALHPSELDVEAKRNQRFTALAEERRLKNIFYLQKDEVLKLMKERDLLRAKTFPIFPRVLGDRDLFMRRMTDQDARLYANSSSGLGGYALSPRGGMPSHNGASPYNHFPSGSGSPRQSPRRSALLRPNRASTQSNYASGSQTHRAYSRPKGDRLSAAGRSSRGRQEKFQIHSPRGPGGKQSGNSRRGESQSQVTYERVGSNNGQQVSFAPFPTQPVSSGLNNGAEEQVRLPMINSPRAH